MLHADMPHSRSPWRTARQRVFSSVLSPAGFIIGANRVYIRHVGQEVHGITLQPSRYGGEYFVNLAFHYDFLPAFLFRRRTSWTEFDLLDFLLRARLEHVADVGHVDAWPLKGTTAHVESSLRNVCELSVGVFGQLSVQWSDPMIFLDVFSAEVFTPEGMDVGLVGKRLQLLDARVARNMAAFTEGTNSTKLSYFLATIAINCQHKANARTYLKYAERTNCVNGFKPYLEALRLQVEN